MIRIRRAVFVAVFALPCALGASWLGCANGEEEVDGTPKRKPGSDTGGGTADGGDIDTRGSGGDGGGGTDTSKPLCTGETGTPNACSSATDLGAIAVGSTKNIADGIPLSGGDLWYKVKFETLENLAAHPKITLTASDPAIVLEIVKSCAGDTISCGDEDAFAVRIKAYESVYRPDPDASGSFDEAGVDAFIPLSAGEGGTLYIRVFRTTGTPSGCDFKLDVSN